MADIQQCGACPQCGSETFININLTMEDGNPVSFYSCHSCDTRWWDREGKPLNLASVLELARRTKREAGSPAR